MGGLQEANPDVGECWATDEATRQLREAGKAVADEQTAATSAALDRIDERQAELRAEKTMRPPQLMRASGAHKAASLSWDECLNVSRSNT